MCFGWASARGQTRPSDEPLPRGAATTRGDDPVSRIRDEGLNRSQAMQTLSYLSDVIGPRLTGSPNLRRANEWTRERLESWGLSNAHLEAWGPFGRGWSLKRFSAQVVSPQDIPLIAFPKAWTPGFERPVSGEVVHVDAATMAELRKYHGKLRGAVVLFGAVREVQARFEPLAVRLGDTDLLRLANSDVSTPAPPGLARTITPSERLALLAGNPVARLSRAGTRPATVAAGRPASRPSTGPAALPISRVLSFMAGEGAAVVVTPSTQGDGGTFFVTSASVPGDSPTPAAPGGGGVVPSNFPRPWATTQPIGGPAQVVLATEQFNRLVRMIRAEERLTMEVDLRVALHEESPMAYNTVAEIRGTDLADEVVMLGAHMDCWHSGTGATDNGAGCAAVMEAVRIIKALGLEPRRTIRVALWTGEEQGLLGSKAYVGKHFGYYPEPTTGPSRRPTTRAAGKSSRASRGPGGARGQGARPTTAATRPALVKREEYEKLSVYFNLDNGTGKVRGVYLQGNEAVRPLFRKWLAPFADLGASTLTLANTGGTDHLSFDAIGLPGFQFIQDPVEYWTRTHHSNEDVFDRIQADDLKEAAVILATFAYDAAMMDAKVPRKPERQSPAN
jgi:hypothetical protein